jgi:hypothetical protein
LLLGERQLLWTLQQIFYYGFKNRGRSSFRKQIFLWDYILRVHVELKLCSNKSGPTQDQSPSGQGLSLQAKGYRDRFITLVDEISSKASCWGKEGKFTLFLLISLRDRLLGPHFLRLLSRPSTAQQFYDSNSFLRELTLNTFLNQILTSFNEMRLIVEPSLTKGL